ncbi:uncharacterized protein LOC130763737 [Actinidia eriantha]|uniref:uncharacterized protein LOC130763737 n=1 Tax=Actinidia eriantha TaxID=165200 RepID=UPI0025903F83|nr:uncharacterized protein LOC130763737 [Actinidia eriantha]
MFDNRLKRISGSCLSFWLSCLPSTLISSLYYSHALGPFDSLHMIKKKNNEHFIAFKEALKYKRSSWQLWETFSHVAADVGNLSQVSFLVCRYLVTCLSLCISQFVSNEGGGL